MFVKKKCFSFWKSW